MKTEFIALSQAGAIALFCAGGFLGMAITQRDIGAALIGVLCAAVARENSQESFETGSYGRGWLMWKRRGPST